MSHVHSTQGYCWVHCRLPKQLIRVLYTCAHISETILVSCIECRRLHYTAHAGNTPRIPARAFCCCPCARTSRRTSADKRARSAFGWPNTLSTLSYCFAGYACKAGRFLHMRTAYSTVKNTEMTMMAGANAKNIDPPSFASSLTRGIKPCRQTRFAAVRYRCTTRSAWHQSRADA